MKFFKFGKKDKVLDLTERYRRQQEKIAKENTPKEDLSQNAFSFLGNLASANSSQFEDKDNSEDRKKKLAKRLMDLTNKIEEISNQIYHLQQRVELLEKKTKTGNY
jgi:chromosome segregation ATPase